MARARNIKPGFFTNEDLVELPFEFRLLFIGMWTLADKSGRMEDRPKKIKMEVFPADNVDIDAGLNALASMGFIRRYTAGGTRCIEIVNWGRHQSPHHTEKASTLPSPVDNGESTVDSRKDLRGNPPDSLIHRFTDSTEANASAADAATDDPPPDPIWGTGLAYLLRCRIPEKQARSLLGKIRQACGDVETGALLSRAEAEAISDPAPWLMAAASKRRARAGPNGQQPMGKQAQGLMALEAMKSGNRMAAGRTADGAAEVVLLGAGAHAGR